MTLEYIYTPYASRRISQTKPSELLLAAQLCNNAKIDGKKATGEPTEAALLQGTLTVIGDVRGEWQRIDEIAFTPERKMMCTVNKKEKKKTKQFYTPKARHQKCLQNARILKRKKV